MSYRIDPRAPLSDEVRRIGIGQIGEAIALLDAGRSKPDGGAHEVRKRFKRLRGLIRLVAAAAPDFRRREERRIKAIAASLSAIRDATAAVETIDRLVSETGERKGAEHLIALRVALAARRDRIVGEQGALERTIDRAAADLRLMEKAFESLCLPDAAGMAAELLAKGMEETWFAARKASRKAGRKGRDRDFHRLRKSVKYHEMHLQLLSGAWPALKLRRKEAERLGERLGEMHDIPVLMEAIGSGKPGTGADRKFVRRLLQEKRRKLGAECLNTAGKLFKAFPEEALRGVAVHYVLAALESEPALDPIIAGQRPEAM